MTSTHNPPDRQPGTRQPRCWPQLGDLAIDTAHGDGTGVIVGVPGEEGSLWLTFHLQPPGGGEEWSAPADASTLRRIPDPDALPRCAGEPYTAAGRLAELASAETPAVLGEIRARVAAMAGAARDRGTLMLPPLLLLGTSERVGSNWLSDTLRPVMDQHNEPFRQQAGADHPLSALSPHAAAIGEIGDQELGTYGRHWLVSFVTSKYSTVRHVVKETNLFFAVSSLLAMFPDSPVAVLSRSPLGVASSFLRSALFTRWDYRARYRQMITITASGTHRRYACLVPDDNPSDLVAITRLHVLNAVLLAAGLEGRDAVHVPYEGAVQSRGRVLADLGRAVPELAGRLGGVQPPPSRPSLPDGAGTGIFSTAIARQELVAYLSEAEARTVGETAVAALATAAGIVPVRAAGQAAAWLSGGDQYRLATAVSPANAEPAGPSACSGITARYVRRGRLEWRNLLVTNAEFAVMLSHLGHAGLAASYAGAPLLACQMPHERGGRLHHDPAASRWRVSDGYEGHPVYWVTWIGAAAFAAWEGARLPSRAEITRLTMTSTRPVQNAGYRFPDVAPVTEPGLGDEDIHHLAGNLQVWCSDGPDAAGLLGGPAARWLHGAAWNTPGTPEEIHRARARHMTGSSRGVGIRLVRDGTQHPASPGELAGLLDAWISSLADRSGTLAGMDSRLIRALSGSQADAGLSAHVAASTGEPGHG
jgi:hypothetical protein